MKIISAFFNLTGINETVSVFELINEVFLLKLVEDVITISKSLKLSFFKAWRVV